ncbi:MAG: hypothetical protein V1875_06000 [Candidatus Altiarchaeota archaeon]
MASYGALPLKWGLALGLLVLLAVLAYQSFYKDDNPHPCTLDSDCMMTRFNCKSRTENYLETRIVYSNGFSNPVCKCIQRECLTLSLDKEGKYGVRVDKGHMEYVEAGRLQSVMNRTVMDLNR